MKTSMRPQAIETRDIARVRERVAALHVWLGILEMAALGRLPWGFLNERERKGWLQEVERACDEAEREIRVTRIAARTAVEDAA